MSDMSNYLETKLGDLVLRGTAFTAPAGRFLALFTAITSAEAGTGTEVTTVGTAYARQAISFGVGADGVYLNDALVAFLVATANYGTVTHVGIFDAVTGGNALSALKALPTPRVINTGDQMQFPVGNISVSFA